MYTILQYNIILQRYYQYIILIIIMYRALSRSYYIFLCLSTYILDSYIIAD